MPDKTVDNVVVNSYIFWYAIETAWRDEDVVGESFNVRHMNCIFCDKKSQTNNYILLIILRATFHHVRAANMVFVVLKINNIQIQYRDIFTVILLKV